MDWMFDSMDAFAPWPIESMAMTDAIPMTMPSIVSPDRTLFDEMPNAISSKRSAIFIRVS